MKSLEKAMEMPRSFFSSLQEDILEGLLSDMVLAPLPDGGPSSLAVVPEQTPPFLLSPTVDIPAPCPNSELPENPLRRLLVPEERECQLWRGRCWGDGSPYALTISLPLHVTSATAQSGSSR